MEDKLNLRNSFRILYRYVCKEVAKRILVTKVGITSLNRHISLWAQSTIGPPFLWFLFLFSISPSVSDECRFKSSERRNFTRAQSSVSYTPLSRWGVWICHSHPHLLDSSLEQISVFNNNMLARAPIYHGRNIFAAKHANGKSESLKSLFAGRTDVLEWAIATISQVTVSAR